MSCPIAHARRVAGLTQAELARRMGTHQPSVARWESGAVSPTVETLVRVGRACGLLLRIDWAKAEDA